MLAEIITEAEAGFNVELIYTIGHYPSVFLEVVNKCVSLI